MCKAGRAWCLWRTEGRGLGRDLGTDPSSEPQALEGQELERYPRSSPFLLSRRGRTFSHPMVHLLAGASLSGSRTGPIRLADHLTGKNEEGGGRGREYVPAGPEDREGFAGSAGPEEAGRCRAWGSGRVWTSESVGRLPRMGERGAGAARGGPCGSTTRADEGRSTRGLGWRGAAGKHGSGTWEPSETGSCPGWTREGRGWLPSAQGVSSLERLGAHRTSDAWRKWPRVFSFGFSLKENEEDLPVAAGLCSVLATPRAPWLSPDLLAPLLSLLHSP